MSAAVASFTDAWIETVSWRRREKTLTSHLLQMRGLKHLGLNWEHHGHKSHLLQMRGLKPLKLSNDYTSFVASFTDAWIETLH